MSGGLGSNTPSNQDPAPAEGTGAHMGVTPDCLLAEGSENMSVTNSEVESAMNLRCFRAILRAPRCSKEAFDAFSSADAYMRAAQDGLGKAIKQHLTDVRVRFILSKKDKHMLVAPETESSWHK